MAAEIIPIKHNWETRLDKNTILVKHGLETNGLGIVQAIIAGEQLSGIDHLATFHNHIDKLQLDPKFHSVPDELAKINTQAVQAVLNTYENFHNTVEKLTNNPGQTPYAASWENEIINVAEKAKKAVTGILDNAVNAAKATIRIVSHGAQEAAANVFGSGSIGLHLFLGKVWTQVRDVVQNPVATVAKGWNHVKSAAQAAANWFKGIFYHSATLSATISGHDEGAQSASLGQSASLESHATKEQEGHSHSATHGGGSHQAHKRRMDGGD